MVSWFSKLFGICDHKWEHLESVDVSYNCHTQVKREQLYQVW